MASDPTIVEAIARALCAAEGRDPDELKATGGAEPFVDAEGVATMRPVGRPYWETHVREVERFIAMQRGLGA